MTKHIPGNPTIIVQSVPGAGSAVLANRLAEKSPRDGTAIGQAQRTLLLDPLLLDSRDAFAASPSRHHSGILPGNSDLHLARRQRKPT